MASFFGDTCALENWDSKQQIAITARGANLDLIRIVLTGRYGMVLAQLKIPPKQWQGIMKY